LTSLLLMRATFPENFTILDLIILIILGGDYKLWSFSLCTSLQPRITSSLLGPNILLTTLFLLYCQAKFTLQFWNLQSCVRITEPTAIQWNQSVSFHQFFFKDPFQYYPGHAVA
jgi:hypothetical protein